MPNREKLTHLPVGPGFNNSFAETISFDSKERGTNVCGKAFKEIWGDDLCRQEHNRMNHIHSKNANSNSNDEFDS